MKHLLFIIALLSHLPIYAKNVLVTIAPLHSLVKNVSGDLNNVELLINSNVSPHHYQLKPSDVKKIKKADVIFTVGEGFELFLQKSFNGQHRVPLVNTDGLILLPIRGQCSCHDEGPLHPHTDLHFWGSPHNAEVITNKIAEVLSSYDPNNRDQYTSNAQKTLARIDAMNQKIKVTLAPVKDKPFLVFHDGYQYFENYYKLQNVGTIAPNHDHAHGAKTLNKILDIIKRTNAQCIFAEPQFSSNAVKKIAKHAHINVGYLNIEGGMSKDIQPEDLYFSMMEQNAINFARCFS